MVLGFFVRDKVRVRVRVGIRFIVRDKVRVRVSFILVLVTAKANGHGSTGV